MSITIQSSKSFILLYSIYAKRLFFKNKRLYRWNTLMCTYHFTSKQKNETNFVAVRLCSLAHWISSKGMQEAFSAKEAITGGFSCASIHEKKESLFSLFYASVEQLSVKFYEQLVKWVIFKFKIFLASYYIGLYFICCSSADMEQFILYNIMIECLIFTLKFYSKELCSYEN